MSIIHEIQSALMSDSTHIGHILLKMRFLASQIGSEFLAEWVRHELEGYPKDVSVPDYRRVDVSYTGSFSGPFGSGIQHAPLPSYLIERFAGKNWVLHEERQSISSLYEMYDNIKAKNEGHFSIDATNLILLIQGKIYPGYVCNSVVASIDSARVFNILFLVRSKLLDLTIELEKSIPGVSEIEINQKIDVSNIPTNNITNIVHQIIGGDYKGSTAIGDGNVSSMSIGKGDSEALIKELVKIGIPKDDASEFAAILKQDGGSTNGDPLSKRAQKWLAEKAGKIADGAWGVGLSVATDILKQSTKQYLGLP